MSKELSFKLGQEHDRGAIYAYMNAGSQQVIPNEGQILFGYSKLDTTKIYPYKSNIYNQNIKPKYDVRLYLDFNTGDNAAANSRMPISSYFSDYSSKLWNLSSGSEFNVGDSLNPVYFENGIPEQCDGIVVTTGAQTFSGIKTFSDVVKITKATDAGYNDNGAYGALVVTGGINSAGKSYMAHIYPKDSGVYELGNYAKSWGSMYSKSYCIFDGQNNNDPSKVGGKIYTQSNTDNDKFTVITLGNNIASTDEAGRYGIFQIYSTDKKYQRIRAHTDVNNGTIYLRNHGANTNNYFIVATTTTDAVGGSTFLDDGTTKNGDKPVYISSSGVATACDGIVVTTGAQTFSGNKTFSGNIYPKTNKNQSFGSSSNVWLYIHNREYRFYGSSADTSQNYISLKAVTPLDGTAEIFIPKKTGYMTISKSNNYHNNTSSVASYNIPFYTDENIEIGCNDAFKILTKKGTAGTAGQMSLILGNSTVSTADENYPGELRLYGNGSGYAALQYDDHGSNYNQQIKFRKYNTSNNSTVYPIVTTSVDAVGGETKIGETSNGKMPVYISAYGIATACDGIVVTTGAQTFSGIKTFSDVVKITKATEAAPSAGALIVDGGINIAKKSYMYHIFPQESGKCVLGNESKAWESIYNRQYMIFDGTNNSASTKVGGKIYTQLNTHSDRFTAFVVGNGIASSDVAGRYGILQVYSTNTGYQRIRAHTDVTYGELYLRNHGANAYVVATTTTDTVGGETKIGETSNGDKPIYISDKGVATACNGIVVTTGAQTFSGDKTFSNSLIINSATDKDIGYDNPNTDNLFKIQTPKYAMRFDSNEILVTGADGNGSILYLNDGGQVQIDGTFHLQQAGNFGSDYPTDNLRKGRVFFKYIN